MHLVKLKADELGVYMPLVSAFDDIIFKRSHIADASAALMDDKQPCGIPRQFVVGRIWPDNMKLFFLRHGEAAYNKHDDIRELTARGCDDVKRVAQHQRAALADVQRVFVSPLRVHNNSRYCLP